MDAKVPQNYFLASPYEQSNPPSYEQVVAQPVPYQPVPSAAYTPKEPKFTYIDFTPDGQTCKYPDLIEKANFWLAHNKEYILQSCETVTVPVKKGVFCTTDSVNHIPSNNGRDYASVLRCWVFKTKEPVERPQVLKTIVRLAEKKRSTQVTVQVGFVRARAHMIPFDGDFKPLSHSLKELNEELEKNPLSGKILRVETVKMKVTDHMCHLYNLDPNALYWTEGNHETLFVNNIRLFYLEGEPANEQIGWKDIVPTYEINRANPKRPKFEPHSTALFKAGQWAHMQTGKRITNIQTIDMPLEVDHHRLNDASRPILDTNQSEFYCGARYDPYSTGALLKFLRLYYVTSPNSDLNDRYSIAQRLFIPYKITAAVFETPVDNIQRLGVWMDFNSSSIENDNIICAETVDFPTKLASRIAIDTESSSFKDLQQSGHDTVSGIRLYISGTCYEPPVELLRIPPAPLPVAHQSSSECCTII